MCGIAGWVDLEADVSQHHPVLAMMTETLSSRGPDASGIWLSPRAGLGHRRLIVIDPEGGAQPMTRQRGGHTYTITYNGELYNTLELRQDLESRGYHFFTRNSDTEVLLHAFMEWGWECVHKLNGIFAFAIWDDKEQTLFMARDRLGVKPLFYTQKGSAFLFGSEPKALLAHPDIKPEIDQEGLAEIFVMGQSRTPGHGVFRNISEVEPGCCLTFNCSGMINRRYWKLISNPHPDTFSDTVKTVRDLLEESIERQLISDVPVCTLLSGGLDSSAITAFASRAFKESGQEKLRTYSVDYENNALYFSSNHFQPDADAPWIASVSKQLNTEHKNIVLSIPKLTGALYAGVEARDLPGMADIDSSLYLFCREIKKEATVALSGEAADELFGGYPWFHDPDILGSHTFPWIRSLNRRMHLLSPETVASIRPEDYIHERYRASLTGLDRLPGEDKIEQRRREIFYLNIIWFMSTLLDRKDRMSMACGLEVRVPYCDHKLVEYVWNIPWKMKFHNQQPKGVLRQAMSGIVPENVLHRRKAPFPKTHHPAYLKTVKERLTEVINDPGSPLVPLVNLPAVRERLNINSEKENWPWFGQLMGEAQLYAYYIQVDYWFRKYKVSIIP